MANQTGSLDVMTPNGRTTIRVTLVDSAGGAATFPSIGGAASYPLPYPIQILDFVGDGTTAPATATHFQLKANGNDQQKYINGANAYDPKSTIAGRIGALLGYKLPQGTTLQFTGR